MPATIPFNRIITARFMKTLRTKVLVAPNVFSNAIVLVLSRIRISKPLTMVTPATASMRIRITQIFIFNKFSQSNIWGNSSFTVNETYEVLCSILYLEINFAIWKLVSFSLEKSFTVISTPYACLSSHLHKFLTVLSLAKTRTLSNWDKSVL